MSADRLPLSHQSGKHEPLLKLGDIMEEAPDKDAPARDTSPCSPMIVSSVLCSCTHPPILLTKGCFSFARAYVAV